jgi:putative transposase
MKVNRPLREQVREQAGREATPSAAIVDAQSVKTTPVKGERGFAACKKVNGRKRHVVVDTFNPQFSCHVTKCSTISSYL